MAHQRAAEGKAQALVSSTQGESRAEIITLEAKIAKLEEANNALQEKERVTLAQVSKLEESKRSLKEKEREARAEVERLSAEGKESSSSDKEVAELRAQLRTTKAEAAKAVAKASDAEEELELLKETSKEKEKALKAKYREAQEERLRLAVVEVSRVHTGSSANLIGGAGGAQGCKRQDHQEGIHQEEGSCIDCRRVRRTKEEASDEVVDFAREARLQEGEGQEGGSQVFKKQSSPVRLVLSRVHLRTKRPRRSPRR